MSRRFRMAKRKIFLGGEFLISDILPEDCFTPEDLSREHRMVYESAVDFVKKEIVPNIEKIEEKDESLARSLIRKTGELGLNGIDIPVEYGGEGMDKITTCLVTEAMGAGASFAVSHSSHTGIGTLPIVFFGTERQKKRYLPKLATGELIAAYCLTESSAGSDALNSQSTAVLSEDEKSYVLNGEKIFITNGAWADVFIIYAKVDGSKFTGFIVERAFPGISSGEEEKKLGIKGSSTTPVIMKDCIVPAENVLFEIGQGHKIAFNVLNVGRLKLGASVVGPSKVAIIEAAKYANMREQFGRRISSFGMIKNKLADMSIRTFMAESLAYRTAAAIDDRLGVLDEKAKNDGAENAKAIEEYAIECSIAKVFGSECLDFCVDELVQILGGNGYITEYPAERMYRDSRINRIFEGTNEVNRLLIPGTFVKRGLQNRLPVMDAIARLESELKNSAESQKSGGSYFLIQENILKNCKKIHLMTCGTAVSKLLSNIAEEQEVMAMLADMIIMIYAMESGLLRARKMLESKGEQKAECHIAAVKVYVNDAIPVIAILAKQVLAFIETGEPLDKICKTVDKLASNRPFNTVSLRRIIADKIIKTQRYPF
jgi:alkylation response protein AidB-like acyl-CoA dehydrogenase